MKPDEPVMGGAKAFSLWQLHAHKIYPETAVWRPS
jgi:hypothetical protein